MHKWSTYKIDPEAQVNVINWNRAIQRKYLAWNVKGWDWNPTERNKRQTSESESTVTKVQKLTKATGLLEYIKDSNQSDLHTCDMLGFVKSVNAIETSQNNNSGNMPEPRSACIPWRCVHRKGMSPSNKQDADSVICRIEEPTDGVRSLVIVEGKKRIQNEVVHWHP